MAELPILDVADKTLENSKRLVQAAEHFGFLYVSPRGTALTKSLVNRQFELSQQFFALPTSEKARFPVGTDNRGWLGMHNERLDPAKDTKEFKEALNIGEFDLGGTPQQKLPEFLSTAENLAQLRTFEDACRSACDQILDLLGMGLEIEDGADWFSRRHGKPSGSTVRMLHYPSLPAGSEVSIETDVRAGAHSDYGSITLLFQRPGQPGLEIRPPGEADSWAPVPVFPASYPHDEMPPILVNIGDLMSYWTEGLLRSTVHRVIFPRDTQAEKDRYSLVFFCHPLDDAELVAVPSKIVQGHKSKTTKANGVSSDEDQSHGYGGGMTGPRSITAREHLLKRLAATYSTREERAS